MRVNRDADGMGTHGPPAAALDVAAPLQRRIRHNGATVLLTLKIWLYRALPFFDRFADEAPACCGTCAPCVTATASGIGGTLIATIRRGDLRRA